MYMDKKQTIREKRMIMKRLVLSNYFRYGFAIFIFFFSVSHIINLSVMSTKGYDITDLQKQITVLERENQKLEFKIAKNSSMSSIQERMNGMNMVAADKVEYMTITGSVMARR